MEFMAGEYHTLFGFYGLEEYDGELFVFIQVEWTLRPDWATATHTLIEHGGNRAVIETIVSAYCRYVGGDMNTITYRFTMIDGRIDSGLGQWNRADEPQTQNVPEYVPEHIPEPPPGQNIFANVLTEYFVGGVAVADNMMRNSTKAFLVDVTGSGRPGMVAVRHFTEHFAQARIFYYVEGQLIYKDIPHIEGFPYSLAVNPERLLIMPAGDGGHITWSWFHLDFSADNLRIEISPTLYRALNESDSFSHYFTRGGREEGFEGGFEPITEEEFDDIFQMNNLGNLTLWFDIPDETARILSMTLN
jgi:hypothetical protein